MFPMEVTETVASERASPLGALKLFMVHLETELTYCNNQVLMGNASHCSVRINFSWQFSRCIHLF